MKRRFAEQLVGHHRTYHLLTEYTFKIFNLNNDDQVTITEVHDAVNGFTSDEEKKTRINNALDKRFAYLKENGAGDGKTITR